MKPEKRRSDGARLSDSHPSHPLVQPCSHDAQTSSISGRGETPTDVHRHCALGQAAGPPDPGLSAGDRAIWLYINHDSIGRFCRCFATTPCNHSVTAVSISTTSAIREYAPERAQDLGRTLTATLIVGASALSDEGQELCQARAKGRSDLGRVRLGSGMIPPTQVDARAACHARSHHRGSRCRQEVTTRGGGFAGKLVECR